MTSYFPPNRTTPIFNSNEFPPNIEQIEDYTPYDARYIKKTGDTMTGDLFLNQNMNVAGTLYLASPINISSYTAPTNINEVGYTLDYTLGSSVPLTTATNYNLLSSIALTTGRYFIFMSVTLNCSVTGTISLDYGFNTSSSGFLNGDSTNIPPTTITSGISETKLSFSQIYQATTNPIIYLNFISTFSSGTFDVSTATLSITRLS